MPRPLSPVEVRAIDATVRIEDQIARTTLTITFFNPAGQQQEGQVLLPVPMGAVLKSFAMEGASREFKARVLPKDEARRIYDRIVAQSKDPAILEFAGHGAVDSSVFPIPGRSECKLRFTYEELVPADMDRLDYVLLRSESPDYRVKWNIDVKWALKGGIATAYSPSHEISPARIAKGFRAKLGGRIAPGPFRLSVLRRKKKGAVASFLTHPEEGRDGGHFLLLIVPPERDESAPALKREVTVVIDRSGSMAGEKMDQARAAAAQVVEGLEEGEFFNLIIYNEAVEPFAEKPVIVNRDNLMRARKFIEAIRVSGGTNIHGALQKAIAQPVRKGIVPIVLFLTDGLPTIGETSEKRIREKVRDSNRNRRRIFTFGVGVDVNTPLLSRLADDSRATATYVLPKEKVEVKVASVFRRLSGPVLSVPRLKVVTRNGEPVPHRIDDLVPHQLPDFFSSDQIIVTGRYRGSEPLEFRLTGDDGERRRKFTFAFRPGEKRNPFVPRLWAMRKIAVLTEALRDLGADSALNGLTGDNVDRNDPRVKELVNEIVRLSTEHGILSEYTAFLALEGEVFRPEERRAALAAGNFDQRALKTRSGKLSVNQDLNLWNQKQRGTLNPSNEYVNGELEVERVANVAQFSDMAFFKRGNEWVDASLTLAEKGGAALPVREITVDSAEFKGVVDKLVAKQRQSCLALGGSLELVVDGTRYRVR
jgi:Ca-activated chloride channel family protein